MSEPAESPAETRRAIMEATYRAICSVGYAGLTMAAIADEFEKSQSLIHYHYDTKEELLTAFLGHLIEGFVGKVESGEVGSGGIGAEAGAASTSAPRQTLEAVVDALLAGPDERADFTAAMLELRAQAAHSDAYREQFVENDAHLRELLAGLLEACADAGELPAVEGELTSADADALARRLLIAVEGARARRVVLDDEAELDAGRALVAEILGGRHRADGRSEADA